MTPEEIKHAWKQERMPSSSKRRKKPSETFEESSRKKSKSEVEPSEAEPSEAGSSGSSKADQATIAAAQKKYQGKNPLSAALEAKDEDAAEALLDGGADPNEIDGRGRNALHWAAFVDCRLSLFHRILGMIHNVNVVDNTGSTALILAAVDDNPGIVTALMKVEKINVNVQNNWKRAALHEAVKNNSPAIVTQILGDDKVDTSLKDDDDRTPMKVAILLKRNRHEKCLKILMAFRNMSTTCCK